MNVSVIASQSTWIEGEAIRQLEMVAHRPDIIKVVGLPDLHPGKGTPIGAAFLSKNRIYGDIVGSDIGCVDKETEYLSPTGWKYISDYTNDRIMQYDHLTGYAEFVQPINFIKLPCEEFFWFKTKYGINQMLSSEHKILCWRDKRQVICEALEIVNEHNRLVLGSRIKFETTFTPKITTSLPISDNHLRVHIMVLADGTLREGNAVAVHIKKQRKIDRCELLLKTANIPFTKHCTKTNTVVFRFIPPLFTKTCDVLWQSSLEQLKIISEECLKWDGNEKEKCFYSRDKSMADFIHYVFSATGFRGVLRDDIHHTDGQIDYRVFANTNTKIGIAGTPKSPIEIVSSENGFKYCFTVPTGFWIMRRGGNIVITGNCGMSLWATKLSSKKPKIEQIAKKLNGLDEPWQGDLDVWLSNQKINLITDYDSSLGTPGFGNHFIEIQEIDTIFDESIGLTKEFLYMMVHSGSRGFGKSILDNYVAKHGAKGVQIDTSEGQEYIIKHNHAMNWAIANRDLCAQRVLDVLDIDGNRLLDICHNSVTESIQDGCACWLHRKGAAPSDKGLVVIPGSRGDLSYLVRPLESNKALNSLAHGAGRKLSRTEAHGKLSEIYKKKDIKKNKWGGTIVCGNKELLWEEAPECYKSINSVITDLVNAGLIEIIASLRPLVTFKTSEGVEEELEHNRKDWQKNRKAERNMKEKHR